MKNFIALINMHRAAPCSLRSLWFYVLLENVNSFTQELNQDFARGGT